MAAICDFRLRISGRDFKRCQELVDMFPINNKRNNKNKYLKGRIYDVYVLKKYQDGLDDAVCYIELGGECANSIRELIDKYPKYNLITLTKRLELVVECWGENNDVGIQELCVINQGEIVLRRDVVVENYVADEFEDFTDEEKQEISDGFHLGVFDISNLEEWQEYLENERYSFGGFGSNYGCFWFDIRNPQESLRRYENVLNCRILRRDN